MTIEDLEPEQKAAIEKINTGDSYTEGDIPFTPTLMDAKIIMGSVGDSSDKGEG